MTSYLRNFFFSGKLIEYLDSDLYIRTTAGVIALLATIADLRLVYSSESTLLVEYSLKAQRALVNRGREGEDLVMDTLVLGKGFKERVLGEQCDAMVRREETRREAKDEEKRIE